MNVLVCIKRVPAPGARISITDDGLAVDTAFLGFTMSPHEECAVEAAVQLIEQHGGVATVLTLGLPEAEEQLRYAASLGVKQAVLLPTNGTDWDPQRTAAAIASAVAQLEAEAGAPFDLILFGNESADSGGFQVGVRVAHSLGRPMVNGIKGIEIADDGSHVTARRPIDAGFEVFRTRGDEIVLAERVREELERTHFHAKPEGPSGTVPAEGIAVTCSIGIATFPDAGATWDELFKAADDALYVSKRSGRNRSTPWSPASRAAQAKAKGKGASAA